VLKAPFKENIFQYILMPIVQTIGEWHVKKDQLVIMRYYILAGPSRTPTPSPWFENGNPNHCKDMG
jgi:hypothetical protein